MAIQSQNPATEEVIASFEEHTEAQINQILDRSVGAFKQWRNQPFAHRAQLMTQAAKQLRAGSERLATLMTLEMGKPIAQARAEVEKCAWCCDYFAENAESFLADIVKPSAATESYVAFDPLGAVLAIMPWNFPLWQVFRFAAPGLMAGNVGVLKHASNVPQCALAIEEVFTKAGFPRGAFQTVLVPGAKATALIDDPRIAAVTLTGSEEAGAMVAEAAGRALKPAVFELGGSDPYIVLEDADVEAAARVAIDARFQNVGQSCIAAKRFIVVDSVADEFQERFRNGIEELVVGDPMDASVKIGPLAKDDLVDTLEEQVKRSVAAGATVVTGGERLDRRGYYYAPTLIADVKPGMQVFSEETFGPAAALIRAADTGEAIALANDSRFGLGAALWTRDVDRGKRLAREIEAGAVFINGMVASDPRLPFGGVKRSGYGRELADFGIREFVNIKTVWIGPTQTPPPAASSE
ncbi:MAG TPA: NAD-dependent succinate-semialdehyde dehydrogenase [Dehalococcoidia bacterium]|nr:NAD-dependent succinate-semialdehyde dehydrogenase [Dehalococcoidia bacterium]